ncbi:MAG: hypothetical protein JWO52_7382 [Gammaproteobacteria bacterium]|jgi:hypothetical protein|nr:hypothetical protein [Gammaproteobacteria bacterium]
MRGPRRKAADSFTGDPCSLTRFNWRESKLVFRSETLAEPVYVAVPGSWGRPMRAALQGRGMTPPSRWGVSQCRYCRSVDIHPDFLEQNLPGRRRRDPHHGELD